MSEALVIVPPLRPARDYRPIAAASQRLPGTTLACAIGIVGEETEGVRFSPERREK